MSNPLCLCTRTLQGSNRFGAGLRAIAEAENVNGDNTRVVTACICAGLYPNVIRFVSESRVVCFLARRLHCNASLLLCSIAGLSAYQAHRLPPDSTVLSCPSPLPSLLRSVRHPPEQYIKMINGAVPIANDPKDIRFFIRNSQSLACVEIELL